MDLYEGWNITANQVGDAINADAAGEAHVGDDAQAAKDACVDAIVGRLGALGTAIRDKLRSGGEIQMPGYMNNAYRQSVSRRDATGDHTWKLELYAVDDQKQRVASAIDEDKPFVATASSAVVNHGTIL